MKAIILSIVGLCKVLCCMGPTQEASEAKSDVLVAAIRAGDQALWLAKRVELQALFLEESKKIDKKMSKMMDTNPILYNHDDAHRIINSLIEKKSN